MFRHLPKLSNIVNSIFSNKEFPFLLAEFEKFRLSLKQIKNEDLRIALSKKIYLYTKKFFEDNKNILSPIEKANILDKYIKLWDQAKCILNIRDTEFANQYEKSKFGKYHAPYNESSPMVAGFNLQGIFLGSSQYSNVIFLSVNFEGADFSNAGITYSHFEDCNLSKIKTTLDTNLNQGRFVNCDLKTSTLHSRNFCEVIFTRCNLEKSVLKGSRLNGVSFDTCNLQAADLKEADLTRTRFFKCNLFHTIFDNDNKGIFRDCVKFSSLDASPDGNPLTTLQTSLLSGFIGFDSHVSFAKSIVKVGIFSPVNASPESNPMTDLQVSLSKGLVNY